MKTRFFSIMVLLFALVSIAKATNNTPESSVVASSHESNKGFEMTTHNDLYDSAILDEWISARENWEQESRENEELTSLDASQILEDWVSARANWENEGSETDNQLVPVDLTILEKWNTSCENWEQR